MSRQVCPVMCLSIKLIIPLLMHVGKTITSLFVLVSAAPDCCDHTSSPASRGHRNLLLIIKTLISLLEQTPSHTSFSYFSSSVSGFYLSAQEAGVYISGPRVAHHQIGEKMHPKLSQAQTQYKTCWLTHKPWRPQKTF